MRAVFDLVAGAALSLLVANATPAFACDCHDGGPVCQAFWETPIIFAGRVESVTQIRDGDFARLKTRFRVSEQFRGAASKQIELVTGSTSCDVFFKTGQDWLIYAFPAWNGVGLTTGTCSRSRLLKDAGNDLDYLRNVYSQKSDRGRVYGTLLSPGTSTLTPVAGALVSLGYTGRSWTVASAVTDAGGNYEMRAYPGSYVLTATLPRGFALRHEPIVNLRDGRGCAKETLLVARTSDVTGYVVDHSGSPIPNLTIELMRLDTFDTAPSRLRTITDNRGYFAANDLEVGRYKAAIVLGAQKGGGPSYLPLGHPKDPRHEPQFETEGGKTRALGVLKLPATVKVAQVNGVVANADGRPAPHATIRVKVDVDGDEYPWTTIQTDSHGRFAFGLATGTRYRFVAERRDPNSLQLQSATITVDPSAPPRPLRILLGTAAR